MLVGGMMIVFILVSLLCFFVSLLFFLFSYLIGKKKVLTLIAGYDEKTFKGDKDKLAKATSIYLLIIGVLTLILPLGLEFIGSGIGILFTFVIIFSTVVLVICINYQ